MKISSFDKVGQINISEKNIKNLKVGDVVKGNVISNDKGLITLRTTGNKMLSALFLSEENIVEGKAISIIINQITQDKIYAKVLKTDNFDIKSNKNINMIIQELGIENDDINKDLLRNLLKFLQPINKDKVEYFDSLLKASEIIKSHKNEILSGLLMCEENFLELPIDILSNVSLTPPQTNFYNYINNLLSEGDIQYLKVENYELFVNNIVEKFDLNESVANDLRYLIFQANKSIESVETINKEVVSYLLSKNLEVTPQNLFVLSDLVSKGRGLASYLVEIIDILKDIDYQEFIGQSNKILEVFLETDKLDKDSYNNQVVNLIRTMEDLEEALVKRKITNFQLNDSIQNLKSILTIVKSINENFNYYNMPILINNFKTYADIYIYNKKKRGKKIDLSDASILISLDLEYLGHIESLIHISNKLINIIFKTENKTISNFFSKHFEFLIQLLESKGYDAIISVTEKKDEKMNLIYFEKDLNQNKAYRQGFDVRL